jgi:hypothetical protein
LNFFLGHAQRVEPAKAIPALGILTQRGIAYQPNIGDDSLHRRLDLRIP